MDSLNSARMMPKFISNDTAGEEKEEVLLERSSGCFAGRVARLLKNPCKKALFLVFSSAGAGCRTAFAR
jgi:hypothetical protein